MTRVAASRPRPVRANPSKNLFLDAKSSKALAAGIKGRKPTLQLSHSPRKGWTGPEGNALQLMYLDSSARTAAKGLTIAYVDFKSKTFYAQGPGTSGLARGPFDLPKGFRPKEAVEDAKPSRTRTPSRSSGSEASNRELRGRLNDLFSDRSRGGERGRPHLGGGESYRPSRGGESYRPSRGGESYRPSFSPWGGGER